MNEEDSERADTKDENLFPILGNVVNPLALKEHVTNILTIRSITVPPEIEPLFNPKGADN